MAKKTDTGKDLPSPEARWIAYVRAFDDKASLLRSLVLNSLLIATLALSLPILFVELTTNRVVIAPLSVPPSIEQSGLTGTVVANRLWDAWSKLNAEVAIAKETRDVLPSSQRIEFAIPDSGLSFDSFIHHLRSFFGFHDTTLSGEMVCEADLCSRHELSLRLRLIDKDLHVVQLPPMGDTPEDTYWRKAISEVMLVVDPVRGILATRLINVGKDGTDARAIAELRKLVRDANPDANWALAYAGSLLSESGDTAAASASFDEALKSNPKFVFALRLRANSEMRSENLEAAKNSIVQALAIAPEDAANLMQFAMIEARMGETAAAETAYAKAGMIKPNWPQIPLNLGAMYTKIGKSDAAKAAYLKAIEIDPDFVDAHELLALTASLDNDFDEAIGHQQIISRLKPDDAGAQDQLGVFFEAAKNYDAALKAYQQASILSPSTARYWQRQGLLFLKQKKIDLALEALLKAQSLDVKLADIWFNIGDAFKALDRKEDAKNAYQNYMKQEPQGLWFPVAEAQLKFLENAK